MNKATRYLSFSVLFVMLCVAIVVFYAYFSSVNQQSGSIALHGLHGEVIIQTDRYGIPHIDALKSDEDAFFALGYLHARDRLWQMEFQRRISQGTLSENLVKLQLKKMNFYVPGGFIVLQNMICRILTNRPEKLFMLMPKVLMSL